jgi:effector-binding domain-containing protein
MVLVTSILLTTVIRNETPKVVHRNAVPFISVRSLETMNSLNTMIPRFMPKLQDWASHHGLKQVGAIFFRYHFVDMKKGLDVEVGFITDKIVKGDNGVTTGLIPSGDYVSLTHFGNYSGLVQPNAALQTWAKKEGLTFKMAKGKLGEEFVSRIEFYKTDPEKEPNPDKWETEILYMITKPKR